MKELPQEVSRKKSLLERITGRRIVKKPFGEYGAASKFLATPFIPLVEKLVTSIPFLDNLVGPASDRREIEEQIKNGKIRRVSFDEKSNTFRET